MKAACLHGRQGLLIPEVLVATRACERMVGLLGRRDLPAGTAMYLVPCNCIHTFLMRFALDLVFLDGSMRVARVVRSVAPNRVVFGGWTARGVIEMSAGWCPAEAMAVGERWTLRDRAAGGSAADGPRPTAPMRPVEEDAGTGSPAPEPP